MRICIDPGHGGIDPGAIGRKPFELREADVNLAVSVLLETELEALGHAVVVTRRRDRTLALTPRAAFANRRDADLFVSVHANAGVATAHGMEVFHFPGSEQGEQFANSILAAMLEAFPSHRDRGVKEANFTVLRKTRMPAVLVELEFLTNPEQLVFLSRASNMRGLAAAIAYGISAGQKSEARSPAHAHSPATPIGPGEVSSSALQLSPV